MRTIDKSKPVLVTGGSGYVAGWIVKILLEDGIDVHATVRDPNNPRSVAHLKAAAADAPGNLRIFKADLLEPSSFDSAMCGCELVFHTASPFVISGFEDANEALVKPALMGTRNVLDAVDNTETVRRVVLTSSVAAIYGDNRDAQGVPGGVFTEEHWNQTSSVNHQPYSFSKTVAEREAWEICAKQDRWDLVVVNPGLVLGPSLSNASHSESLRTFLRLADGTYKLGVPQLWLPIVDVRDTAWAHYNAGFIPEASGRHIVVAGEVTLMDLSKCLQEQFGPKYPFPKRQVPKPLMWLAAPLYDITRAFVSKNVGYPLTLKNDCSRDDLKLRYRPIDDTVVDHFRQIIDDGILPGAHA